MIRKNLIYIVVIAAGLVAAISASMEKDRQPEQSQTATSTVIVATSTLPIATSTTGTIVSPATSTKPVIQDGCYVGGCSGQICSDQPDMVSTCEYRKAYGCYKSTGAKCERQASGQCGWTQSVTLTQCIQKADATGAPTVY